MNCRQAAERQELKLSFVNRMWSLERANCFVDTLLPILGSAKSVTVFYEALAKDHDGYYDPNRDIICISRKLSTPEKWRTLIHEMAHVFCEGHDQKFLEKLIEIRRCWHYFNTKQKFAELI